MSEEQTQPTVSEQVESNNTPTTPTTPTSEPAPATELHFLNTLVLLSQLVMKTEKQNLKIYSVHLLFL